MLIFNSPNNPTGTVFSEAVLEGLATLAIKHDLWVIADEIYARILFSGEYKSIRSLPGMAERTVIVDGFSKSFAMTGWRLGYAVAPVEGDRCYGPFGAEYFHLRGRNLRRWRPSRPCAIPQRRRSHGGGGTANGRDLFVGGLNQVPGFRCQMPSGAFYAWVNIEGTGLSAEEVQKPLLEEAGVAGIAGAAFGPGGKNYLRFSLVSARELLVEASGTSPPRFGSLARRGFALISNFSKLVKYPGATVGSGKMQRLIHLGIALLLTLAVTATARAQAKPLPGADVQKIYDRLLKQIEQIPIYDNHSHATFPDDSDMDAMASPPGESHRLAAARQQSGICRRREGALRLPLR